MADGYSITPARHRALLSVSISWTLRETITRKALTHGLSVSDVVETALTASLAESKSLRLTMQDLLHCTKVARECRKRYPPLEGSAAEGKEQVYFLQADSTDFVKIGRSLAPYERLKAVQTNCMFRLKMLYRCAVEDAIACEHYWHRRLHAMRTHGEWFLLPAPFITLLRQQRQL